jgi:hypothetical protein
LDIKEFSLEIIEEIVDVIIESAEDINKFKEQHDED